jgi:hypothetical protein
MTYPISKFVETAKALRENYPDGELITITSDETSLTVSRTETVENNDAVYEYGSYIKLTPPTENYEGTVEEYAENLLDQLYGFGDDEGEDDDEDDDE